MNTKRITIARNEVIYYIGNNYPDYKVRLFLKKDHKNHFYITNLATRTLYRKKGLATELLQKVIKKHKNTEIRLVAKPTLNNISKEELVKFYKNVGFYEDKETEELIIKT